MTGPTPKTFTCVGCDLYSSLLFTGNEPIPRHQCRGGIELGKVTVMESSDTPVACRYLPWKTVESGEE